MITGRIHSIESMGLVDGPGIRTVVFLQGCKLRCAYCHNPDTWGVRGGDQISPEELVKKLKRFKPYFERSGGGVTFSGGDPLLQPDFLAESLKLCKENGIHTTIDTSGYGLGNYEEILKYTDLVLLDFKHINDEGYLKICGSDMSGLKEFINTLNNHNCRVWVRHVVVPGITDSEEHILELAKLISSNIKNLDKVELLPYHLLGVNKYETMNIPYKLADLDSMSKEKTAYLQSLLNKELSL